MNLAHAVGVIFENSKGKILVLKRHNDSLEGETWGLVGGNVDEGESRIQAAVREVKEEIGAHIDENQLIFLKTYHWERPKMDIIFETFKYPVDEKLEINLDKDENTKFMWVNPRNLRARDDLMIGLYLILEDQYDLA